MKIKSFTPYNNVNEVLDYYVNKVNSILGDNVIGIYLFGSLSYNDFNPKRSDMDISVVVKKPLTISEGEEIKKLHLDIEKKYPDWRERIEGSYAPLDLFESILPPKQARPYFGGGEFYFEAPYGHEWIINNYLLYHKSVALYGPDFKTLINPIDIREVQKASIGDLYQEWEPKLRDREWLNNSHYQSYLVLNLCRILYTVMQRDVGSKTVSSDWVKKEYPQWKELIEEANSWGNGMEMKKHDEVLDFLKFVLHKIPKVN